MLEVLEAELNRDLKGQSGNIIRHIAHHMISSTYAELGIKAALQQLLSNGCRKADILAALVRCELQVLNMMLPEIEKLDEQGQAKQLCDMIERFNGIKDALILAGEEIWQKKVMQERCSRVLNETRKAWMKDRQLVLYNLFDEMPVRASAHISKWDENFLQTKVTPELGRVFSACLEMRYAYIDSPIEGFRIKVMIHSIHGSNVQLKVVKTEVSEISRREKVRVGLDHHKPAKLFSADKLVCIAKLAEFSLAGLGLIATEELPFVPGERLRCQTKIGKVEIDHIGEVTWIQPFIEGGRFGLKVNFDQQIQLQLNREILSIQRSKIDRLSRLGMPITLRQ